MTDTIASLIDALAERIADAVAARLADQQQRTTLADELVDEPAMSELLGVSQQTLQRLRAAGDVPCVRLGRRVLYQPDVVLDALSGRAEP